MVLSGQVELLDNQTLFNELRALERRTRKGGRDLVDHPPKGHDDLANAVAGVCTLMSKPQRVARILARSLGWRPEPKPEPERPDSPTVSVPHKRKSRAGYPKRRNFKMAIHFHTLRSGYVGTQPPQKGEPMLTNEMLPPGVDDGAPGCPTNGQCDICVLSNKCTTRQGLLTAEERGEIGLLPTMFHKGSGAKLQTSQSDGGGATLLPQGVSLKERLL